MNAFGSVLRINLTTGSISREQVNEKTAKEFVGGRGYGTKILYDELPKGTDPLSPENKLLFVNGPLTGQAAPAAGRYMVITKSPLTGTVASSNSGGFWGAELAKAGWFMIILEGKAEKPSYIWIKDDQVEIRDASSLWGLNSHEATDNLLKQVGEPQARVACIGPAGEKGALLAAIMNDKNRAAGRSGVGAVMGSKNLKAVAIRGTKGFGGIRDFPAFLEVTNQKKKILADNALLRRKIESLERKYDEQFQQVFQVLTLMLEEDAKPKEPFGFRRAKKN